MDNFLLQSITTELTSLLVAQRLGKVYQLGATDLALDLRLRDGRTLVISTDPQRLALYLTKRNPKQLGDEARTDTAFVALVKKYLGSARLLEVEKLGYDRVVYFTFSAEDDDGSLHTRQLAVWLTGRAANVLLIEAGHILASLRDREDPVTAYQEPPPPAEKLDPFQCNAAKLKELRDEHEGDLVSAAQKHLLGFTPVYAHELAFRAARSAPETALHELLAELFEQASQPTLYAQPSLEELRRDIGRAEYSLTLAPIRLRHLPAQNAVPFPSLNEAADAAFTALDERRRFLALRQRLTTQLNTRLKKQRTLRANLQRELAGFAQAETHQRYGELLLANLHQASKSETGFRVTDFYDEQQAAIDIPTANKATAQEAAEHYFKLARKARHGQETIQARLPEIETEIAELEARLQRLAAITQWEALQTFAAEFGAQPVASPNQKPKAKPTPKAKEEKLSGVRRYRSSDGFEVLVGRTDKDNDTLTFRTAKSYDLWFHAADYPGSHVVLRNPQRKPPPPRAITEAAQLAAKFSQARENAKVAVNYCEKKFVTKPKGFAAGQVRLASFKTVLVEPAEAGERIL